MITHVLVLLITAALAGAITVFDCSDPASRTTTLDLTEPAPCPDPVRDFQKPTTERVQILQAEPTIPITAGQCLATITKRVNFCGFDHINYNYQLAAWMKNVEFTPEECRKAIKEKRITVENRTYNLTLEQDIRAVYWSHGSVGDTGRCTEETFVSEGRSYTGYQEVQLELVVRLVHGQADMQDNRVDFNNGLKGRLYDQVLRDQHAGVMVWDIKEPSCEASVSEIYYGNATYHELKDRKVEGSIIMVANQETQQYAGLQLKDRRYVCDQACRTTQLQGVVVCFLQEGKDPVQPFKFRSRFAVGGINVLTQLAFHHLDTNFRMYRRFETLQTELCELERKVLHGRLQAIAGGNNRYALLDLFGKGHQITLAGAAAQVTRCATKEAVRTPFPNCTTEIPVRILGQDNATLFADPFTFTLREFPTIFPCSSRDATRWKVGNRWFCSDGEARICDTPVQLNTSLTTFVEENFADGLGRGIYTPDQIRLHEQYLRAQHSRDAVLQQVINQAIDPANGFYPGQLGMPVDVQQLAHTVASDFWPLFGSVGDVWSKITGAMMALGLAKALFNCGVRMYILYVEQGCGWHLLAALWGTFFALVRYPIEVVRSAATNVVRAAAPVGRRDNAGPGAPDPDDVPTAVVVEDPPRSAPILVTPPAAYPDLPNAEVIPLQTFIHQGTLRERERD